MTIVTLAALLQLVAMLCFLVAAFGVVARLNLVATGLALFMLSILLV